MHRSRTLVRGRRRAGLVAALTVAATVSALLVSAGTAGANPPPNPSDSQLSTAAKLKASLAVERGQLGAQVAQLQARINQLKINVEIAEQKLAYALQKLQRAQAAATAAKANVQTAQNNVVTAQNDFNAFMSAVYMSGDISGTTGALLTADDPSALLAQGTLQGYQSTHQLTAIGNLQRATVARSNADAAARVAVQAQASAAQTAKLAQAQASTAYAAAQQQQAQLQTTLAATQAKLNTASLQLASLTNQRTKYLAYQKEQARLAELRRQQELQREREARQHQAAGGGGGGGGGGSLPTPPPQGGSWTAAKGQEAVSRAAHWVGLPYVFAGGNASGPTDGGCTDPIAPCGTLGFDCSGLTLNAWAPWIGLDHYANTQYSQAGSFHPAPSQFMPGDLLFWGNPSADGGLHHVAIYAGGGNVIQAPDSGMVIQYTPWNQVSWDYYGATRPLT